MVSKLGYQKILNEFNSHWVSYTSDLVSNQGKFGGCRHIMYFVEEKYISDYKVVKIRLIFK